jgi:hypothetical protein
LLQLGLIEPRSRRQDTHIPCSSHIVLANIGQAANIAAIVLELGLALELRIAQTRRLKATAYGGGVSRLPKFGVVTELVSGSP